MHKSRGKLSGVLHKGFKPDKCKTSLRMAMARIKLLRNRKEVAVRQMRREVAQLLEANQDQNARIRVEHVIREEKIMQAYDLIEIYCELIVARLSIIDSQKICPIDLKEAVASVIFASMRCADVTELADVRKHFTSKYGKEFAAASLEVRPDSGVNRLVIEKLSAGAPDVQTKIKTLTSIAEEHNIKWEPKAFEEKLQKQNEDLLHGLTAHYGGNISTMGSSTPSMSTPNPPYSTVSAASVDSGDSHVPVGLDPPSGMPANNASRASAPLTSQYSPSTYYSSQIPGSNNFLHEISGGQSVSKPYSQYDASAPVSRDEEINQPRERKPFVSGANWNMEFKDATSAAQAAAESAEMASIAARAAAQLASRGNYSGKHSNGGFESEAYNHQNTPRKQTAVHSVKGEKKSFNDQSSHTNDSRMITNNEGKHSAGAETSRFESQNTSTDYSPSQDTHSYNSESHSYVYGMPVEPVRVHSPEPSRFDDLYDSEGNIGRHDHIHPIDFPEEKFQGTTPSGHNVSNANVNQVSSDHESTDDDSGNYSFSHGTFTHGSKTVWDTQNDETQVNPSSAVFDECSSDVKDENVFDSFASKHTEQLPGVHDNVESSNADWSRHHRNDSPSNHSTSDLFSRTETQKSDILEASKRDIPSPHSYENLPPTFDSDGGSSDEEIAARPITMHAETLRSHSKGSNSGKLVRDANESSEDYYESSSGKKSGTSLGLNLSYKEQLESGHSPRNDYSRAQVQRNFSHVQSRDSDISEEESEPELDKLKFASSLRANENQSLPFVQRTSATFDGKDEDDFDLNFRLTPGLRNKPMQTPPYHKSSREDVLPRQSFNKASASMEESVDSEEGTTFEPIRGTIKSSRSTKTSSGGGYSSELYNKSPSVETPKKARSTMAINSLLSDDTENLPEQFGNASLVETKGSERRNSAQELYHDKTYIGGRRQLKPAMTKNFFDSDDSDEELQQRQAPQSKRSAEQIPSRRTLEVASSARRGGLVQTRPQYAYEPESMPKEFDSDDSDEELQQRQAPQSKRSAEQIPSRRTLEVASSARRGGLVQTRPQYAYEPESMPKERKVSGAFSSSDVEERRDRPDASIPVQEPSTKPEHNESPIARRKLQKAETDPVPANENTETSAGTPKETTSKTAPAHVHPKLPTDYDSFAAHFKSLRTNRR